jgi:Tol biopolymer transport system component
LKSGKLKRLTQEDWALSPHCSPDGRWVIYNAPTKNAILKISIEGGMPSVLEEGPFLGARFSPDGKQIATYDLTGDQNKIRVFSVQGGPELKSFALASPGSLNYWDYSLLHWTPDGRALTYPLLDEDSMNLWKQPLTGGPPQQITHFKDLTFAYDWSSDGKRLAISRGRKPSDVVLIRNFRE